MILGAITTNLAAASALVDYVLSDWKAANLKYRSAFKPVLFTIDPAVVLHRIGRLTSRDLREIDARIHTALELSLSSGARAKPLLPEPNDIDAIIRNALAEDVGSGDVTTLNTVPGDAILRGTLLVKADGVVAGLSVFQRVFELVDPRIDIAFDAADGQQVRRGQIIAAISGPGRAILTGERLALNILQRMSGIASETRRFVDAVAGTRAVILDTRKTAPGLRVLDKLAVRLGGGQNHRFGLYDMAMIKDNHIAAVGSIGEAVRRVRAGDPLGRPIEVEVTDLAQLREALELGVDRILLDNMSLDTMAEAVRIAAGRTPLEASGGVNLDTVAAIAATGVDLISVGALTHSVTALDISLDVGEDRA